MADALVIFKPDASHRLAARAAIWAWLRTEREWKLEALRWYQPSTSLIEGHYDFLQGKPFFGWLVEFMSALPVIVGRITAAPESLERMRQDLGETRIAQSRPGSLREQYGIFGGINCMHLSDAPETGAAEVAKWTKEVKLDGVEVDLDGPAAKPDHTYHLRSLATQIAAGIHTELATAEFRRLLAEETELEGEQYETLARIIVGGF